MGMAMSVPSYHVPHMHLQGRGDAACLDLAKHAQGQAPASTCKRMLPRSQFRQCWLKWLAYAPVAVPRDASLNESVGWTSGSSTDLDLSEEVCIKRGWVCVR
eukprot:250613-Chlamydomonas_euryale.AAC.1